MILSIYKKICKAIGVTDHLPREWTRRLLTRASATHPIINILNSDLDVGLGHHHHQIEVVGDVNLGPLPRSYGILCHNLALPKLMSNRVDQEISGLDIIQSRHHRQ